MSLALHHNLASAFDTFFNSRTVVVIPDGGVGIAYPEPWTFAFVFHILAGTYTFSSCNASFWSKWLKVEN